MDPSVLDTVLVLAAEANEEFIPRDDWRNIIALPAAFVFFFVSVFWLVRSNLGTRRAYLVCATSFFAFMVILSLFWTGGAPGTPIATGPQSLPGQPLDYWSAKWEPFAVDSVIADQRYPFVKTFPEGFAEVPEDGSEADTQASTAADELLAFFSTERAGVPGPVGEAWVVQSRQRATATDGATVVAITFAPPPAEGEEAAASDETYTGFAFFDPGFVILPSLVMVALSVLGFGLHVALLWWDENREREARSGAAEERRRERVPAGV